MVFGDVKKVEYIFIDSGKEPEPWKEFDRNYVTENFDLVDKIKGDDLKKLYGIPTENDVQSELLRNVTKIYLAIHRMNQGHMRSGYKDVEKAFNGIVDKKDVSHALDFLDDFIRIQWEYGDGTRLVFIDYWDMNPKDHEIGRLDAFLKDYAKKKSA